MQSLAYSIVLLYCKTDHTVHHMLVGPGATAEVNFNCTLEVSVRIPKQLIAEASDDDPAPLEGASRAIRISSVKPQFISISRNQLSMLKLLPAVTFVASEDLH